jgi:dipeptidyl aminopeptidase/acylaminoacyl peptidase
MSENSIRDSAVFERRFGELLSDYARTADRPFDAIAIATVAAQTAGSGESWGPTRAFVRSLRVAGVLLVLLALMAALAVGALVISSQPRFPAVSRIADDEVLVTRTPENKLSTAQVVAISVTTGETRVVADGLVMAVSPDRTRFVRRSTDSLVISDADGADLAETASEASLVAWSPDGRFVLLTDLGFYDRETGTQPASYAVWDIGSNAVNPLSLAPYVRIDRAGNPVGSGRQAGIASWAPDSQHLLLPTEDGLIVTDLKGELVVRIAGTSRDSVGSWSPDGTHILHENRTSGELAVLAVRDDFSSQLVETLSDSSPRYASWSPDGSKIAFITDDGVAVASRDDLSGRNVVYRRAVIDRDLLWSPDGRQLAFVAWAQNDETGWLSHALYVMDATGANPHILVSPLRSMGGIAW